MLEEVNLRSLTKWELRAKSYYLVVARLEPENHADMIIDGFLRSGSRKRLIIVGPLLNTRFVHRLMTVSSFRVTFLRGIYDRASLSALRAGAFAYIHGHEVGGTNPTLLESMAFGTPICAYDVPFNREVAEDSAHYFVDATTLGKCIL